MRKVILAILLLAGFSPIPTLAAEAPANRTAGDVPGQRPDGAILLPNQWSLRPVGKQVLVGDFPVNIALHPGGQYAAILHAGYGSHEVAVLDLKTDRLVSRVLLEETFYGIVFSGDGHRLFCSGAGGEVVHLFEFAGGYLSNHRTLPLRPVKERGVPGGIAVSADRSTLYIANVWGQAISRVRAGAAVTVTDLLLATNAATGARGRPAESIEAAALSKRAEAALDVIDSSDPFPYAVALNEKENRLFVSLWAQAAVAVIDLKTWREVDRWKVEEHPNELLLDRSGRHLFVANANRNSVSVLDTRTGKIVETLVAELQPGALPGNTPNSLALAPDGETLYVANANINMVAVFDVSKIGRSRSLGFIPVGWYPTSVRVTSDGRRLLVANGKGLLPKANRHGPQPRRGAAGSSQEYIAGLFQGTVSIIDLPTSGEREARLAEWTKLAYRCLPRVPTPPDPGAWAGNPIPLQPGGATPIRYVFYIIKENRTYDQVLGDLPQGNGDPSLCLFPDNVTPNHHALAREFVLLDNFYVESEVSADGHEWTMGAYATDFVEKTWPLSYGHNSHKKFPYPAEGNFDLATPAGGYLWDRAIEAGVSFRSYGEFVRNGRTPEDPATARLAVLKGNFDPWFRSFDMDYPDVKRAERFISELRRFEAEGEMPRLQIIRLPNDHTSGTSAGKLTPVAQVADNDLAFGMVVEAISRSRFWPACAIFVVEDDAQNGPDHVDAHRTVAYAIGPHVRRSAVDSTMYSTSSMLRTMELILGMRPMSQFDAAAMPLFASFQAVADTRPYTARPAQVDLQARNSDTAWGRRASERMDFTREDAADDFLLNEVIWRSVKGADHPMPAPRRAGFVFAHPAGDDDDD